MPQCESGEIAINYAEIIEDNNGKFRLGELHTFGTQNWQRLANTCKDETPDEAVLAWTEWMRGQGDEVAELPRTARTRAWGCGSMFSATAMAGERISRVLGVVVEK